MFSNNEQQSSSDNSVVVENTQAFVEQPSVSQSPSSLSASSSSYNYPPWYSYSGYQPTSSPYNYYSSYYYNNSYSDYSSVYSPEISQPSVTSLVNSSVSQYLGSSSSSNSSGSATDSPINYYESQTSHQLYPAYSTPLPAVPRVQSRTVEASEVATSDESNTHQQQPHSRMSRKHQLPDRAVEIMNEWFEEHQNNPYPHPCEKERMAQLGGITVKQVTAWFSNRRNRSQNTKPKRIKRVLESKLNEICQELAYNHDNAEIAQKFQLIRNTLENRY